MAWRLSTLFYFILFYLFQIANAPIIPTSQLDEHIEHINDLMEQEARNAHARQMMAEGQHQGYNIHSPGGSIIMDPVQVHVSIRE